jgi:hypothetical protein
MKTSFVACALALACLSANAHVIHFDGHSNTIFGDDDGSNGIASVSLDGYTFSNAADHFHLVDLAQFGAASNGSSSLLSDREGSLTMRKDDGRAFDLISVLGYGYFSSTLTITGQFADGGTISAVFAVNPDRLSLLDLSGFRRLNSVSFLGAPTTPSAPAGFGIDNLTLADAGRDLPEPATFGLIGLGLAAMGWGRRKQ